MKRSLFFPVLIILLGLTIYAIPSAFSQPDLVVTSITHTPRYPTTNDFVTFTVTILNQGNQQAGACILDVTLTGPKTTNYTINAPILASGASWSTQFTQKLNPKGTYTVTATVDFSNVVTESDETNNVRFIEVTCITPNKEDLVVEVLTWVPLNPIETDTITITAGVKNIGPAVAAASTLQLEVGTETSPPTYAIPALDPGATHEIQRQVVLTPGTYQITATADVNDVINESSETNNVTIENITVAAIPKPDLIVSSLTHSPSNPSITDPITITAIVQNTGNADSTTSTLSIEVTDDTTPTTYSIPILTPTQTFQVQRLLSPMSVASCHVTATADADNDNWESDENNNTTMDSFSITGPDLVVSSLNHLPVGPTNIDTITITAIVENTGDAAATTSTLEIDVAGSPVNYTVPSLNPAETHQVQRQIILGTPGSYLVTATADIDDDVTESNEGNNETPDTINVIEAADLIISTLTHAPSNPTITDTITITVVVRNRGGITAGASTLEIDTNGEATPPTYAIPSLAPSQTQQIQRQVSFSSQGLYPVAATADINSDVTESNEGNNTAEDSITVTAPDLVVSSLTHAPSNPTNIDTITITAIVQNAGDAEASTSTLEIDVDGNASSYEIPVLAPGESYQIERAIMLAAGTYPVTTTADINGDVAESNEGNNTSQDSITVENLPDLIVSDLSYEPDIAVINEDITIKAEVRNIGLVAATTSTLTILVGAELTPADFEIPPMDAGTTYTVERHVSFDTVDSYPVTATADTDEEVMEEDEENNDTSIIIDVYEWDFDTLRNYLLKRIDFTDFQKRLYDVNRDGILDAGDLILLIIKLGIA
jgi:subtilase family serine protease